MIEYWRDILYLFGILVAFIGGNRAKKIQNKGGELDNLIKYQAMYEKFTDHTEKQFKILKDKIDYLSIDVANLELRNAIITEEAQTWKEKFSELQKLYDKLKAEFEIYKKKYNDK